MSLVESLDEALKVLSQDQFMSKTLGGSYSDQKICQGCPHRLDQVLRYLTVFDLAFNYQFILFSGILKKNLLVLSV